MIAAAALLLVLPGARLTEPELAAMRGGIRLPDGTDVAVGVAIETQVNGILALRTQFSTERPGVEVFAGGVAATAPTAPGGTLAPSPVVAYDRNAAGTFVTVAPTTAVPAVAIGGESSLPPVAVSALPVVADGPAVATGLGNVTLRQADGGYTAELVGDGLDVRQMIGAATGVVVQNTGNDRAINTQTWVSIDLRGTMVPANLGSTLTNAARAVAVR